MALISSLSGEIGYGVSEELIESCSSVLEAERDLC